MADSSSQPAYVLHRRDYRESSLLLEVFTAEHGRVGLIARGARRSRHGRAGNLQPFRRLELSWQGRGELPLVTAVDAAGPELLEQHRLPHGFYLNELLMRLLQRNDPHPALFAVYERTLLQLNEESEPPLRRFEVALLEALGYGLELAYEQSAGEPVAAAGHYCYELERGPVPAVRDDGSAWVVSGSTLHALASGCFENPGDLRQARRLMSRILDHYLDHRPVKSRELFRKGWKT